MPFLTLMMHSSVLEHTCILYAIWDKQEDVIAPVQAFWPSLFNGHFGYTEVLFFCIDTVLF